jgi:hypothetical protein
MEPRNAVIVGAGEVCSLDGNTEALFWPDAEVPPGSESRAHAHWGGPGTWENLSFSSETEGRRHSAGIVPRKRGKSPRATPWREGLHRVMEP